MKALSDLTVKARAFFSEPARVRAGGVGAGALAISALLLAAWGDPSRAFASARTEMPVWTLAEAPEALGPHLDEDDAQEGHGAAPVRLASLGSSGPRPILRPADDHDAPAHDPFLDLRPNDDPEVEPRLAGVHDLGGASAAHAGAPTAHAGHGASAREVSTHEAWTGEGLRPTPVEALARSGPGGLLPRVAPDGRTAARVYARPFDADGRAPSAEGPLLSIVIGGLGLNADVTRHAIETLPADVTLSFVPYSENLQAWVDEARAAGHEVILETPMEPYDYPANDPGPHTLLARADPDENRRRLEWLMSRATGYFAVMNYLGAKFTAAPEAVDPTFALLADMGVAFLYDGETQRPQLPESAAHAGLEFAAADRVLDARPSAAAIDEQLLHLEALALQNGDSIGAGFGYPVTVAQVTLWAETLSLKGYRLAPVSAVVARRAAATRDALAHAEPEPAAPEINYSRMAAAFGANRNAREAADATASGGGHGGGGGGHGGGSEHGSGGH